MDTQNYMYLIGALTAIFALLAVFAPHKKLGGVAKALPPAPPEDDVIFPEDVDDTMPFIRMPFYQPDEEATQPFRRIANWP